MRTETCASIHPLARVRVNPRLDDRAERRTTGAGRRGRACRETGAYTGLAGQKGGFLPVNWAGFCPFLCLTFIISML